MRQVYFFFFLLTMGAAQLHGQELSIGQMPYRLGMSMQEAMAVTHDPIYLDPAETSATSMWLVREKHGANSTVIGTIFFRNGKAETLERDLKSFSSKDSVDVGKVLFDSLERLKHDDPTVSIQTRNVSGELKIITVGNGPRRLKIVVPSSATAEMTISEVLTVAER